MEGRCVPVNYRLWRGALAEKDWGGRDSKTPGLGRGSAGMGLMVAFEADAGFFAGFL